MVVRAYFIHSIVCISIYNIYYIYNNTIRNDVHAATSTPAPQSTVAPAVTSPVTPTQLPSTVMSNANNSGSANPKNDSATPGLFPEGEGKTAGEGSYLTEEILTMRDPFKRPEIQIVIQEVLTELEKFPAEQFKMIGVLTGPDHLRGMILAPDGRTHVVAEKMKIGVRKGFIRKILEDKVMVREKQVNVLGQTEIIEKEIVMIIDSKSAKKSSGIVNIGGSSSQSGSSGVGVGGSSRGSTGGSLPNAPVQPSGLGTGGSTTPSSGGPPIGSGSKN